MASRARSGAITFHFLSLGCASVRWGAGAPAARLLVVRCRASRVALVVGLVNSGGGAGSRRLRPRLAGHAQPARADAGFIAGGFAAGQAGERGLVAEREGGRGVVAPRPL